MGRQHQRIALGGQTNDFEYRLASPKGLNPLHRLRVLILVKQIPPGKHQWIRPSRWRRLKSSHAGLTSPQIFRISPFNFVSLVDYILHVRSHMELQERKATSPNQHLLHGDMSASQQQTSKSQGEEAKWGVHWRSPTIMVLLFIAGIIFATGHHIYYQSLDDTPVSSSTEQEWTIRIGTGLAFLVKATLAESVGIAFTQYLWTIARRKAMAVESIDAMFYLTTDPFAFANAEVLFHAKLLVLLALASW